MPHCSILNVNLSYLDFSQIDSNLELLSVSRVDESEAMEETLTIDCEVYSCCGKSLFEDVNLSTIDMCEKGSLLIAGFGHDNGNERINLVDPASSHTLVSKIKPCMSKYKQFIRWNCEWLIISVLAYLILLTTWITVVILELIHAKKPNFWTGCIY